MTRGIGGRNASAVGRPDLFLRIQDAGPWRPRQPPGRARQLVILAVVGSAAAAAVGYVVSENPNAAPAHVAVVLRVALILTPLGAGIYGLAGRGQPRMAALLVGAGFYACAWLLNGSDDRAWFSLGELAAGFAPATFSTLLLAYPSGRLRSRAERSFVLYVGGALALFWTVFVLSSERPLMTPLVGRRHPDDVFSFISLGSAGASAVKIGIWVSWTLIACGTPVLLSRSLRTASRPFRRLWMPIEVAAWTNAACFLAFLGARLADSSASGALGAAYIESALVISIAVLIRLGLERSLMGVALARFVDDLAIHPLADLQALLGGALDDPSLVVAYLGSDRHAYVDASGATVVLPTDDPSRAISWIEPSRGPIAAVIYDAMLGDRSALVDAATAAAAIRIEAEQLEAELTVSTAELAASRLRLLEAGDAERRRIERDLHDGVQQQIVGLRLKLDLASEMLKVDPVHGERMLTAVGGDLDELLGTLRLLAKGIYPSILKERGLRAAIASAALNMSLPVSVRASHVARYREEIEVAVYFCCVEALQNVVRHAGPGARADVRIWQTMDRLYFAVHDSGVGFDPDAVARSSGLVNMRDRVEAVGGRLWVVSHPGGGTSVRGRVPAAKREHSSPA